MKHTEVYQHGEDNGWLLKQNYWFDPNHEHGFEIQDLDALYPDKYFEADHVKPETIENYCRLIPEYYAKITGQKLSTLTEVGSAGGWFLKRFKYLGYEITGLEGTDAGIKSCESKGLVNRVDVFKQDFRRLKMASHVVDMVLCTEVAEHIEPPFSAGFVQMLTKSSDLIWFSFEEPNTNPAHIHHPNEMPAKFWLNLFEFYGFGAYKLPQDVYDKCEGRGMYIMYNKEKYEGNQFLQQ